MIKVFTYVPEIVLDSIDLYAKNREMTRSQAIREILLSYFKPVSPVMSFSENLEQDDRLDIDFSEYLNVEREEK